MAENFPNLARNINLQIPEAQQMPHRINLKKSMPRHIILKFMKTKDKEKNLELASEKWHLSYRGKTTCVTANFSSKTMEARKKFFKYWKKRTVQPESYTQQKYPSRTKGKSINSHVKEKLTHFHLKRICSHQAHSKRTAIGSSRNRKEFLKKIGLLEHQRGKTNIESKKYG